MSGEVHDVLRQFRLLGRHVRYARLVRGHRRTEIVRAELEGVYRATNRLLADLGVEYWLAYGTLLGYHREGGLIAGDWDIDFGAPEREYSRIWAARAALPPGFRMYDTSHRHHGPKLYVERRGWEADIYFYREAGGRLQSCERSRYLNEVTPVPRELVYPLRATTFLGEPTTVPRDAEACLVHTYRYIGADAVRDPLTGYWRRREV